MNDLPEGWRLSTVPACKLTCGSFSVTCGLPPPRQLRWRMLSSCPSVEGYRIYRNPTTSNPKIQTTSGISCQLFNFNSKSPNDSVNQTIVLHRANPLDPSNAEDPQRISPWTAHGSLEQRHPKHPRDHRRSRHVQCPWHHLVASVAVAEPWGLWYPRNVCGTLATSFHDSHKCHSISLQVAWAKMFEFEFRMHMFETGLIAMCVENLIPEGWTAKVAAVQWSTSHRFPKTRWFIYLKNSQNTAISAFSCWTLTFYSISKYNNTEQEAPITTHGKRLPEFTWYSALDYHLRKLSTVLPKTLVHIWLEFVPSAWKKSDPENTTPSPHFSQSFTTHHCVLDAFRQRNIFCLASLATKCRHPRSPQSSGGFFFAACVERRRSCTTVACSVRNCSFAKTRLHRNLCSRTRKWSKNTSLHF